MLELVSCGTHPMRRPDGPCLGGFGSNLGVRIRLFPRGFGFGSVPPGQVRIRIGSVRPGSHSDLIRLRGFGFGLDTGSVRILRPILGLKLGDTSRFWAEKGARKHRKSMSCFVS